MSLIHLTLKGGHSKKPIFFLITKKVHIEFSYSPKFQLLKCILSQEICLQKPNFETNAQRPGHARLLSVTSCRPTYKKAFPGPKGFFLFSYLIKGEKKTLNQVIDTHYSQCGLGRWVEGGLPLFHHLCREIVTKFKNKWLFFFMSYYRGVAFPIYYEEDPGDPQVGSYKLFLPFFRP